MFPRTDASGFKLCPMYTFLIFIISLVPIEIMSNDLSQLQKKISSNAPHVNCQFNYVSYLPI